MQGIKPTRLGHHLRHTGKANVAAAPPAVESKRSQRRVMRTTITNRH